MSANTLLTSVITGGSNSHATTAEEANAVATDFVTTGVVGAVGLNAGSGGTGSFAVNADASPDMGVTIKAGQAYVTATPSGQNSQILRVRASTDYTAYTINANASGSTKYDWIYLTISAANANTPSSDGSNVASFVTSRSSSNTTDNGTPPTYGLVLGVVTVANGASSITNSNILDKRTQAVISNTGTALATGWNLVTQTPSSITANGNRSYSVVFSSVDLTGSLATGMRLRTTRTTPAPTQCTSLNGTTQYYSKSSPAGMTFTDDFVVSAWVKLSAYNASNQQDIAARYNGTSGWSLVITTTGQVQLAGFNAGAANFSTVKSYQSVPLNKWIHITAQLDMSTFTATPTTSYIMFDGVDVPAVVARGGTNPTALVQAGNLEIGSENTGTNPFSGKIAQVAIYSAKVTQANVLASISQGLAGAETSLISAYSFNNSINDLNANANNLTANGSAVATSADSPFGGQADGTISSTLDYGIIQKTAFSTNTTVTVQAPEGCTIPTTGGVSAVSYAISGIPYNFPKQRGKWKLQIKWRTSTGAATLASNAYGALNGGTLSLPIGAWKMRIKGYFQVTSTATTFQSAVIGLSTATGSFSGDLEDSLSNTVNTATSTAEADSSIYNETDYEVSAQTTVYLVGFNKTVQTILITIYGGQGIPTLVEAENAYL